MDFFEDGVVKSELLLENGVIHGVSTKVQGNMSYDRDHHHQAEKNINSFLTVLGLNLPDISLVKLPVRHSPNIAVIGKLEHKGRIVLKEDDPAISNMYQAKHQAGFDAGISKAKETFIGILPADCAPVMLFDPIKHYYALVHAGRAGVENGIIFKTIYVLKTLLKVSQTSLLCYIGPHICQSCYLSNKIGYCNLAKEIIGQLKMMCVTKIEKTKFCTYHHADLFFSNARAKGSKDEGRHLAIIGRK